METETYKNAKMILERFDPESKKKVVSSDFFVYSGNEKPFVSFCWMCALIAYVTLSYLSERSWNPLRLYLRWLQNQDKVAQRWQVSYYRGRYFPLPSLTSVSRVRSPPAQRRPKDPSSCGESSRQRCSSHSSRLWAHLPRTNYPLCSRWTPREGPVCCSCSAELDEEACDPWNTCSWSRWVTCTQGDHIIMWSIKVWFTLPWLGVPSRSRPCGVCCQQGWCVLSL